MAIPDYQTVMLPLLKLVLKNGPIRLKDARNLIADEFNLTEQERDYPQRYPRVLVSRSALLGDSISSQSFANSFGDFIPKELCGLSSL